MIFFALGAAAIAAQAALPVFETGDVDRFYRLYDLTGGAPTAEQIQRDYIRQGSAGLRQLEQRRNVTGQTIAIAMARSPDAYAKARGCMKFLPKVRARVRTAVARLKMLYPEARLPPITIAISRTKPVGMTDEGGVRIGLEALCSTHYLNPDPEARFVHVIAHELVHIQQHQSPEAKESPTILETARIEGVAELLAELISGKVANLAASTAAAGREIEIERQFLEQQNSNDLSGWFFNGSNERPGDLGYWVGYRIAKSYYQRSTDKKRALRELLQSSSAADFLQNSGWYPGVGIDKATRANPDSNREAREAEKGSSTIP